jgi:hypothetical protein
MKCSIRLATEDDSSLPVFDYTKLTALNMCPRWGLIRYDQHKRMPGAGRSMALEMGHAAHQAYAAIRWFELITTLDTKDNYEAILRVGEKQFGEERWNVILDMLNSGEDTRRRVNAIALYAANTSGFYDDPNDRRRTLSNLENSLIAYIDRLELGTRIPVISRGIVGIEVPFDLVLTFTHGDTTDKPEDNERDKLAPVQIRYIGRMDGLVRTPHGIEVEENKTAARLDRSWQDSFLISHQVTGYCVAASKLLDTPIRECMVRGMMIPLPKNYDLGGIVNVPIHRDDDRIREWIRWIWATVSNLYLPYHQDPLSAPEFSHSCNRYFSSCSFIPLCSMASREDRLLTFSQMETDEWSPLHE